ncbi:hypothetical protein BJ912DRAFT_997419 [Pholiota molesta]|nr:hypothetical protein BJ912DRAFT_997419 [Pholiota molesta]
MHSSVKYWLATRPVSHIYSSRSQLPSSFLPWPSTQLLITSNESVKSESMKLLSWLSLRPYLFLLRTVFILSVIVLLLFPLVFLDRHQSFLWVLVFFSIFLHQLICCTTTTLSMLTLRYTGLAVYARLEHVSSEINPWASQPMLIHALASFALIGALALLALIRLAFVFDAGFGTLAQKLDLLVEFRPQRKYDDRPSILFGSSIWRSHFAGETKRLIVARGSFAIVFLMGIMIFSLVRILTDPVRELRLIPTQNVRTPDGQSPIQGPFNTDVATWGIVLGMPVYSGTELSTLQNLSSQFRSAVSVMPLWYKDDPSNPDCVDLEDQKYNEDIQLIAYYCPSLTGSASSEYDIIPQPYQNFRPDLLVTVNFTTLGISADNIRDIPSNSVQFRVAMSNRTEDVALMTTSTTLIPGVNLIGRTAMEIHQTFKDPGLSFLGVFARVQSTVIAQMLHIFPDPQAGISPLIVRSPEIATIRVVSPSDASQWVIIQDFKDRTFLNGLSQTGGLWTFLSGIFAAVFGSSLMRIVFGFKPVSIFGFAHDWERKGIQKAYREEYPAIAEEINAPRDRRGFLNLLQDHFIDLDLMQDTEEDFSAVPAQDQELDDFERGTEETEHDHWQAGTGAQKT